MCVILHGLKKKHVRKAEVQEAMRCNSAGFFMAVLKGDGKRDTLRTLDDKEALAFFDKAPDDCEFVMHARIPSYGPKSLDNVHGWEEDGILFMHNMSLHNLDGFRDKFPEWKDKTDSEFFFRKVFMPYYRGLGKEAYADGVLNDDLHKFVDWICGTGNRFLFVMPDNRVIRFGTWVCEADRKENGETAFWASNSSYRVFERSWTTGGTAQSASSFRDQFDDFEYGYDRWDPYGRRFPAVDPPKRESEGPGKKNPWEEDSGKTLRDEIGDTEVIRIALADLVCRNLIETREAIEVPGEDGAGAVLFENLPAAFSDDTSDAVNAGLDWVLEESGQEGISLFVENYANELELSIAKHSNRGTLPEFVSPVRISEGINDLWEELDTFCRLANLAFDWNRKSDGFASAYYLARTRTGTPKMEKIEPIDLLCNRGSAFADASESVDILLEILRKAENGKEAK